MEIDSKATFQARLVELELGELSQNSLTSKCVRRERRGESRCSARPLCWGESAGAEPSTVSCPRRALWEAHRSAVSVCRRRVRLASDFVFVVCALSFGGAHGSVWLGVGGGVA